MFLYLRAPALRGFLELLLVEGNLFVELLVGLYLICLEGCVRTVFECRFKIVQTFYLSVDLAEFLLGRLFSQLLLIQQLCVNVFQGVERRWPACRVYLLLHRLLQFLVLADERCQAGYLGLVILVGFFQQVVIIGEVLGYLLQCSWISHRLFGCVLLSKGFPRCLFVGVRHALFSLVDSVALVQFLLQASNLPVEPLPFGVVVALDPVEVCSGLFELLVEFLVGEFVYVRIRDAHGVA